MCNFSKVVICHTFHQNYKTSTTRTNTRSIPILRHCFDSANQTVADNLYHPNRWRKILLSFSWPTEIRKEIHTNKYRRRTCVQHKQLIHYIVNEVKRFDPKICQQTVTLPREMQLLFKIFIILFGSCSRNLCTFPCFPGQFNPPLISLSLYLSTSLPLYISTSLSLSMCICLPRFVFSKQFFF